MFNITEIMKTANVGGAKILEKQDFSHTNL